MDKKISTSEIEVEGCTVEDAIKKAMAILQTTREEIVIKILCEEQKGLFGMGGAKLAKIRAKLKKS